jgi:hypothetical protein
MIPPIAARISSIVRLSPAETRPRGELNTVQLSEEGKLRLYVPLSTRPTSLLPEATLGDPNIFWRTIPNAIQSCQDRHDLAAS